MIRKIWNQYNNSLVLVLPLYNDIFHEIYFRNKKIKYPFSQLCFEYGLVNTYLLRGDKYNNSIFLKFDKRTIVENKGLTTSRYETLLDLIIDNHYYERLYMNTDYTFIELKIPEKHLKDIEHIRSSNYSKVSEEYKTAIKIKQSEVPISENEVGKYLSTKNLGYAICSKNQVIKKEIENQLKLKLQEDIEYYEKFNEKKESWI